MSCEQHSAHKHQHSEHCGHTRIKHDGHVDYLHDGHLHHAHDGHYDEHTIAVSDANPAACAPVACACNHEECGHEKVPHGDHVWEIDVFLDRELVLAEVELRSSDEVAPLPPWLAPFVEREVTDDPAYLNAVMARPDA